MHEDEEVFPKGRSSASKYIVNEPGNRRNEEIKIDVWDDIEGALGENSLKRSTPKPSEPFRKRLSRKTQRQQVESTDTDELLNTTNTPRKYAKRNTNPGKSASRASLRSLANSFRHADPMEVVDQDELAMEIATPPRRTARRTASSISDGRIEPVPALSQSSAKKSTGKQRRQTRLVVQDKAIEATPSRSRKGRPSRFTDGSTVPEIDDEPEQIIASPSKSAISRRTTNSAERLEKEKVQAENIGAEARRDDASSVDGNSVMESVLDPTEPSPFNKPTSARKEKTGISLLVTHLEHGRELDLLKSCIMERISGKRSAPLVGLDSEYKSIHQLVEHTVTAGEGNSLLVIGARGSGKTALVNKVLSEISKDNGQDFHVVRLNGFIHTDDKIALREIWHQLGKEMDLEEENGGVGKNYADTLTTLLALLSHPSEQTGELTDHVARAVIFVMDEFDLFAQHPRQTLLYNLFDIAQARKAPIAVLGLTTRIGVVNSLEKRVKSRFSHRYVHLSLPKTFTAFQETCKANLLVQPELLSVEERGILESAAKLTAGRKGSQVANADIISQWNSNIDVSFAHCSSEPILTITDPLRIKIFPHHASSSPLLPLESRSHSSEYISSPNSNPIHHSFPRHELSYCPTRLEAFIDTSPLNSRSLLAYRSCPPRHNSRQ